MSENPFCVKLISVISYSSGNASERVVFDATPQFTENNTAVYSQISPVHLPGEIQVFRNTKSRTFNIGAKLISRTPSEARTNIRQLQMLRGWTRPRFGLNDTASLPGVSNTINNQSLVGLLGAPPDVLYLWAYSRNNGDNARKSIPVPDNSNVQNNRISYTNVNKVPVVITSLNITYPHDVTYIPTLEDGTGDPFPVMMDITIDVVETHSPIEYERFSLQQYKNGILENF